MPNPLPIHDHKALSIISYSYKANVIYCKKKREPNNRCFPWKHVQFNKWEVTYLSIRHPKGYYSGPELRTIRRHLSAYAILHIRYVLGRNRKGTDLYYSQIDLSADAQECCGNFYWTCKASTRRQRPWAPTNLHGGGG